MTSRHALAALGALLLAAPGQAAPLPGKPSCTACFVGEARLRPNAADPSGRTRILEDDFYFVDPAGLVWKADKDDVTDGASIPDLFKPVIGDAFEADFLPAAIIHDHYTTKAHYVRTWEATALMFYQAMLAKGVPSVKARVMYYAVFAFGPHWGELVPGRTCGRNCVNAFPDPANPEREFQFEPGDYDATARKPELDAIQAEVAAAELRGVPLSVDDLKAMAKARHPANGFLNPPPRQNDR